MKNYHLELAGMELKLNQRMEALRKKYLVDAPNINNALSLQYQLLLMNGIITAEYEVIHEKRVICVSVVVNTFHFTNSVLKETIRLDIKRVVEHQSKLFQYKVHVFIEQEQQQTHKSQIVNLLKVGHLAMENLKNAIGRLSAAMVKSSTEVQIMFNQQK
jgi:hypothetical protein